MELALGTVQFGLTYGVAGRGTPVPPEEVRAILRRAQALGIRWLDTAAVYGDIERLLAGLIDDPEAFRIVSKLPARPSAFGPTRAADWAASQLERSRQNLGPALAAMLFHRADDLLEPGGEALWQAAADFGAREGVAIGVSCYDPSTLASVATRCPVAIAQLPGNAFDQRLSRLDAPDLPTGIAIHLRSAFLQGLLLMPEAEASARVPAAANALARWHAWCREHELAPLVAALSLVKGHLRASHCVVGVDRIDQLEAIADAWEQATPRQAPELAQASLSVIDPRQWPVGP